MSPMFQEKHSYLNLCEIYEQQACKKLKDFGILHYFTQTRMIDRFVDHLRWIPSTQTFVLFQNVSAL